MNKSICAILISIFALATGCTPARQRTIDNEKLLEGVTVPAILPQQQMAPDEVQHLFSVHVFELPADKITTVEQMFELTETENLRFADQEIFTGNGFSAGMAGRETWPELAQLLASANARKRASHSLMITEQIGHDMRVASSRRPQYTHYITTDGDSKTLTLDPGELVWRIQVRHREKQRGQALLSVEAVYKRFMTTVLSKIEEQRKKNEKAFTFSKLRLVINEGQFLLLGPSRHFEGATDIGSLYFNTHADFILPVDPSESAEENGIVRNGKRLARDIPLVKVFLIHCDRVGK